MKSKTEITVLQNEHKWTLQIEGIFIIGNLIITKPCWYNWWYHSPKVHFWELPVVIRKNDISRTTKQYCTNRNVFENELWVKIWLILDFILTIPWTMCKMKATVKLNVPNDPFNMCHTILCWIFTCWPYLSWAWPVLRISHVLIRHPCHSWRNVSAGFGFTATVRTVFVTNNAERDDTAEPLIWPWPVIFWENL